MRDELDYEDLKGIRRWRVLARRRWDETLQTNALLRHLVHEPSFLVALVALVICGGAVALGVPKIWNPAPPNFSKTIRVSLLDYLQAWNLRRTAEKEASEGRWEEAVVAWRTAMVNNLADVRAHRGALETLRDATSIDSARLPMVLFSGEYLIELTGTNRVDCALVADVLVRHRLPEAAMEVMRPWEAEFTTAEEAIWLRALLVAGRVSMFEARWKEAAARQAGDSRMQLYRAAIDATGPPAEAVDALERLRAGLTDPKWRLEAARLLCWSAIRRDDLQEFERGLAVLREWRSTMVQDEAGSWALLARHGRLEEAKTAAREYNRIPPPTPMEAIQLVRAWSELGLGDLGVAMFEQHAARYGVAFDVWAAYLDLLVERRKWDDVRRVAATLRGNASARDDVVAMSWYAEAVADLSEGRRTAARNYLQRLSDSTIQNPMVAVRLASGLIQVGEFETSEELLARVEPAMGKQPDYWLQVLINAQGRRDVEGLQRATDRILELQPTSLVGLNMRLGLMLLKRESPAEALTLSMRLTGQGTISSGAMINHAAALLQNSRIAEASALLNRIDSSRLSPLERAAWQLAGVEYLGQSGRDAEALKLGGQIDVTQLLPPDAAWLQQFLETCRRRAKDANASIP